MSPQVFGRGGPWKKKEKTGGVIFYTRDALKGGSVVVPQLNAVTG